MAQDVKGITVQLVKHRSRQRRIPLGRKRRILVKKIKGADFRVNRHEIEIDLHFITSGNPLDNADRILDAVYDFDKALWEERIRKINEIKSSVLRWMDYLERALPHEDYRKFVESFLPADVMRGEHLDLEALTLIAEGERFQDKEIYFRA